MHQFHKDDLVYYQINLDELIELLELRIQNLLCETQFVDAYNKGFHNGKLQELISVKKLILSIMYRGAGAPPKPGM